jgi:hypothetical protein
LVGVVVGDLVGGRFLGRGLQKPFGKGFGLGAVERVSFEKRERFWITEKKNNVLSDEHEKRMKIFVPRRCSAKAEGKCPKGEILKRARSFKI